MSFDINIWLDIYNKVQVLSKRKQELLFEGRLEIEEEIARLIKESNLYLDGCNMKYPEPLWIYDRSNPCTWRSSKYFSYWELLKKGGK